jgi:DNA-binding transcriptional LysR family regulator
VTRAAERLQLSESAMSRTLARLRAATGDPLLVRAGRAMVLTPHAQALREQVQALARDAATVLQPAGEDWNLATLERTFTLRANDGFIEAFAPALVARAAREAPGVRLRFAPKPDKDVRPLREGLIDLDLGVLGAATGPEVRVQAIYRDHFVGAVRPGHPLLQGGPHPRTLRRLRPHRGLAPGPWRRAGGRRPGRTRPEPHRGGHGAQLPRRAVHCRGDGPGGPGARVLFHAPGRAEQDAGGLCPAGEHRAHRHLPDVAPPAGAGPGPPLAAEPGAGGVPGARPSNC